MSDIRHLLEDARTSVAFAADAECVCGDGPQRCKYCAPHRAVLDRIDEVLGGADEPTELPLRPLEPGLPICPTCGTLLEPKDKECPRCAENREG